MRSSSGVTSLSLSATAQNTVFRGRRTSLGNRRPDAQRPRQRGNPFSGFDKPRARSPHPALAARLDRAEAASPAIDRGAAAPLLPLPLPGWFRPTALLHSCAADPLRRQIGPFLFHRSIEKSAACLSLTCRQVNPVSRPPEIMSARPAKSFQQ